MGAGTLQYGLRGNYDAYYDDVVNIQVVYEHDEDVTDPNQIIDVVNGAESATGFPVPRRRQRLAGTNLFAIEFGFQQHEEKKNRFTFDVKFMKPDGRERESVFDQHPLNYPPVVNVTYMERERVIEKAYNRDAITGGAPRTAGTLGYVQNGAGVQAQTPILDTERIPVIVIRYNVATLAQILSINETYQDTTNNASITIFGNPFAARTLKYQGTDAGDMQVFEGIPYWEAETRIEIHKTTDVPVDSVGVQYISSSTNKLVKILDDGGDPITEPIPIKTDGTAGTPGTSVQINYYYLTEVSYSPLLG